MKGSTFKRLLPSGRTVWIYSVDAGRDAATGKRLRVFKGGFRREKDAQDALRKALNKKDEGEPLRPDPTTFGALLEDWFREHVERKCSPKTAERYHQLSNYLTPIANVRLVDLSTLLLLRVFNELKDSGGRNRTTKEPRPLSAKTVRHIAGVVHTSLEFAIECGLIKVNPCSPKRLPKPAKREGVALDPEKLRWYLDVARGYGLFEFLTVAAGTGCRRGELLAARWSDVGFSASTLRISKSLEQTKAGLRVKPTKSEKPRLISLPQSIIEILQTMKLDQERRRSLYGRDYRTDLDLIFSEPDGGYLKPDSITSKACLIAKKAGLKNVSAHSLRHTHGSLLLAAGVSLPAVSKRLGHSTPYITATVYSHCLERDESNAAQAWDSAVHKILDQAPKIS